MTRFAVDVFGTPRSVGGGRIPVMETLIVAGPCLFSSYLFLNSSLSLFMFSGFVFGEWLVLALPGWAWWFLYQDLFLNTFASME